MSSNPPMTWMGMGGMPSAGPGSLMPGMATDAEMAKLDTLSGQRAEVYFLRLMTEHHKGGVHMAEGCVRRCSVKAEKAARRQHGRGAAVGDRAHGRPAARTRRDTVGVTCGATPPRDLRRPVYLPCPRATCGALA
ncbi:hypothetical protein SFUMM280S_03807 [Streptomyces fumanus]